MQYPEINIIKHKVIPIFAYKLIISISKPVYQKSVGSDKNFSNIFKSLYLFSMDVQYV